MKAVSDKSWWLESWRCPDCNSVIRKHHKARHLTSKRHLDAIGHEVYKIMPSDIAFSNFITEMEVLHGLQNA